MRGIAGNTIAGSFALAAFAVAIVSGLASGNPASSVLGRAVMALVICYPLGLAVGIVAQTTQSLENLRTIASLCICHCLEVRTYNTICQATHKRGAEALDLAGQVDVMIVVGGKNSANTTRLAQAVPQSGTTTYHIESAGELSEIDIPVGVPIGVTAGASTPGWVIDEVVSALKKMD